jgi:processive 1,2-diacylglycerol beta-glucosyltransferase
VHDCTNRGFFEYAINKKVKCVTYCGEFSGNYGFSRLWVSSRATNIIGRTLECINYVRVVLGRGFSGRLKHCFNVFPPTYFYFKYRLNRYFILKLLGLHVGKFTILLGSGAVGSNLHKKVLDYLKKIKGLQVIVVCGRNKNTYNHIRNTYSGKLDLHLDGFSKKIPLYLKVSHLVITRSGSNLSAEAVY